MSRLHITAIAEIPAVELDRERKREAYRCATTGRRAKAARALADATHQALRAEVRGEGRAA